MLKSRAELLKSYGLKATPQRIEILSAIENLGHANIDEIYDIAKKNNPTMSLATVYKNVTSLVEKELLKEVALNNFKSKYETNKAKHSHLVCKSCGSVKDITISKDIYNIANSASIKDDFKIEDIELNIYGLCSSCSK